MTAGRLERFYFETSAVNAVASQLSREAAMNTRAYQNLRGRGYFISPLAIFEVLTTKDDQRREELIYFSQHLFEPTLLPSPEELVVNYIQQGCPRVEPEYHLASGGNTATHWRLICEDTRKTLLYDRDAIDFQSQAMRQIGRLLFDFHSHRDVRQPIRGESTGLNLSTFEIIRRYGLASEQELEDSAVRQHIGLVVILIVVVLCSGITLDREPIERFWRRKGIDSIFDRIHFTFENYANLV